MKKFIVGLLLLSLTFSSTFSAYYEPNADIKSYLNDLTDKFIRIKSYIETWKTDNMPSSLFTAIASDFSVLKNKLPQWNPQYKVVYESCELTARDLASEVTKSKLDVFYSQCFSPWKWISREIQTEYTVKASIKAYPKSGNAPLTVTFDARDSRDPSWDTIPSSNYYWYYKDSNGYQRFIWQWAKITYTFDKENTYIVHLTVRSANKNSKWILDGSSKIDIVVDPPIANISLYINGTKADPDSYVKISSAEGKRWVVLDASWTTPNGKTKIEESTWIIKKRGKTIYKKTITSYPGSIRVKMPENGEYNVVLMIKDNTKHIVSSKFRVIVSNPVAIVKVTPKNGTTSDTFKISGKASYSVEGKISKYRWTINWPNGNMIFATEWKTEFTKKFNIPWNYSIKLDIEDVNGNLNSEEYKLLVESTPPVARFTYTPFDNWKKPSTFVFDASNSYDIDETYWDSLSYIWQFSNEQNVKKQLINNWKKLIAQFNKKWNYKVTLIVKDKYNKISKFEKTIKVESSLRPEVSINPNYTVIWKNIAIKVKTNKPVAYYEYYFWDTKNIKAQQSFIEHIYKKAWVYNLTIKAYSVDGDNNSITKKVFVWQKWYPIAVYKVFKKWNQKLPGVNCTIKDKKWKLKLKPAYEIERAEDFTIDASKSVNSQWTNDLLKIYFKKWSDDEYINKKMLSMHFTEIGCQKITLYVKDLNTNKIDKKDIYFKVKNAPPVMRDLKMFFPQYGGKQSGTFRPRLGNDAVPKDIFSTWFDPLLVKLSVYWAHDKDSSMLSYFRWYYYRKWDRENPVKVKITPANVPEVVFPVSRIPWEYIFGVDVCDVDGGCTNSEDYIHVKPVVNIPKSASNPNYPQINSVRVDLNGNKWVSEVKVWDTVTVVVDSSLPSHKSDFKATRVFKYDFDNDGKWDLITKKSKVTYTFKKPYSKHRVKAIVIYRWNGSNIWYSDYFSVIKWLKILVDYNIKWQNLIYYDASLGDIKKKILCFDLKKCKKNKKYLVTKDNYGHIDYDTTWNKIFYFKIEDNFWNKVVKKKKVKIKEDSLEGELLTLPKQLKDGKSFKVDVWWLYSDFFILYYEAELDPDDCYIDKNIAQDADGDGDTSNDKDLSCNQVYKLKYDNLPKVILLVHDGEKTKKIEVSFDNILSNVPKKYQKVYDDILSLLSKYADNDDEDVKSLKSILYNLQVSLDDRVEKDSNLVELKDWLKNNTWILEKKDEDKLNSIINELEDRATRAVDSTSSLDDLENDLDTFLDGIENKKAILENIENLKQTSSKDKRKEYLENIYKWCWKLLKDWNVKGNTSTWSKVLKIIWWFALTIFILFIIIVIVFVIKAKQRRQEQEEDDE